MRKPGVFSSEYIDEYSLRTSEKEAFGIRRVLYSSSFLVLPNIYSKKYSIAESKETLEII